MLTGNDLGNQILGVAPAGTAGVKPGPPGNDRILGSGGVDVLFGAEGKDNILGGVGNDVLLAFAGNDRLVGEAGTDTFNAGDGDDRSLARDGLAEVINCGLGADSVDADAIDLTPAGDCETITTP